MECKCSFFVCVISFHALRINRYIMECKCRRHGCTHHRSLRINRYIMECKCENIAEKGDKYVN